MTAPVGLLECESSISDSESATSSHSKSTQFQSWTLDRLISYQGVCAKRAGTRRHTNPPTPALWNPNLESREALNAWATLILIGGRYRPFHFAFIYLYNVSMYIYIYIMTLSTYCLYLSIHLSMYLSLSLSLPGSLSPSLSLCIYLSAFVIHAHYQDSGLEVHSNSLPRLAPDATARSCRPSWSRLAAISERSPQKVGTWRLLCSCFWAMTCCLLIGDHNYTTHFCKLLV